MQALQQWRDLGALCFDASEAKVRLTPDGNELAGCNIRGLRSRLKAKGLVTTGGKSEMIADLLHPEQAKRKASRAVRAANAKAARDIKAKLSDECTALGDDAGRKAPSLSSGKAASPDIGEKRKAVDTDGSSRAEVQKAKQSKAANKGPVLQAISKAATELRAARSEHLSMMDLVRGHASDGRNKELTDVIEDSRHLSFRMWSAQDGFHPEAAPDWNRVGHALIASLNKVNAGLAELEKIRKEAARPGVQHILQHVEELSRKHKRKQPKSEKFLKANHVKSKSLAPWQRATGLARKALGIKGKEMPKKGTLFYKKCKEIVATMPAE
eukprot:gnl/MRDRNA2_/MRDRNA2_174589_c0_seq1.p1 gnl/MRDRNA2_/MRDRNA2_174589_c0~~gnl/MRDRNA2_/MRDRNA2_174589_c0_seq1.p1  ORF type:complete len:358 (+),score=85.71 gnl/MRDRNA2_/MRDRNA2_174589_c0_seq1:97-1074(+)